MQVGTTLLRVLETTVGGVVPGGNSLGQEFEGILKDGSIQEGPEGGQGGGGGVLALGGLGWQTGVFAAVLTRERHL